MSSSTFMLYVQNGSADNLTNVAVLHCYNGNITAQYSDALSGGARTDGVECTTFSGHNDYYLIQFVRGGNAYQANCYCNSSNAASQWVIVNLNSGSYDILYNDTNCTNKGYDYVLTP